MGIEQQILNAVLELKQGVGKMEGQLESTNDMVTGLKEDFTLFQDNREDSCPIAKRENREERRKDKIFNRKYIVIGIFVALVVSFPEYYRFIQDLIERLT